MASTVRELLIELGIKADHRGLQRFDVGIQKARQGLKTLATTAGVAVGALGALTAAITANASSVARQSREITLLSSVLQVDTNRAQALSFAFSQFGADADDVADAFGTITDRALDAGAGSKAFAEDFSLLGISVDELRNKSPMELFDRFADAMGKTENHAKRVAAAYRVFGDDVGRKLVPMLLNGSDTLNAMQQEFIALGATMDSEATAAANAWALELGLLQAMGQSLRNMLATSFIPVLRDVAKAGREWFKRNRFLIKQGFDRWADRSRIAVQKLTSAFKNLDRFVRGRLQGWETVLNGIAGSLGLILGVRGFVGVAGIVGGLSTAFLGLASSIGTILGLGLGPAILLVAGAFVQIAGVVAHAVASLGLLMVIAEDFKVFLEGGDSLIGEFIDLFVDQDRVSGQLRETWAALVMTGTSLMNFVTALGNVVMTVLTPAFYALLAVLSPVWMVFQDIMQVGFELFISQLDAIANALGKVNEALERFDFRQVASLLAGGAGSIPGFGPGMFSGPAQQVNRDGSTTNNTANAASTVVINGVDVPPEKLREWANQVGKDQLQVALREAGAVIRRP